MEYRFYSFVAHHYLSPLQCGLQTAHAVSEMSTATGRDAAEPYLEWAELYKTIIICGAGNHAGVVACYDQIVQFNRSYSTPLPVVIFREDEQSMNCMATACGVLVPSRFYDSTYDSFHNVWTAPAGAPALSDGEAAVIAFLKSYKLA